MPSGVISPTLSVKGSSLTKLVVAGRDTSTRPTTAASQVEGVPLDTRKLAFITALHVPPLSQGNEESKGLHPHTLNMASRISTRVSAPASTNQSNHPPTPPSGVRMTGVTQRPSRDGVTLRIVGRKTGSATDLRRKTRIATWNVMSLAGTGYIPGCNRA